MKFEKFKNKNSILLSYKLSAFFTIFPEPTIFSDGLIQENIFFQDTVSNLGKMNYFKIKMFKILTRPMWY